MKHHALAVIAALSLTAGPALAKPAGGEVELHIEASAQVPPDRAEIPIILSATAPTEAEARARIAAQATDAQRLAIATHVVENTGSIEETLARVDALWAELA